MDLNRQIDEEEDMAYVKPRIISQVQEETGE